MRGAFEPLFYFEDKKMITNLDFPERSVLFAKLSKLVYSSDQDHVRSHALELGFDSVEYYDSNGAQAYRFSNCCDTVIICRGTEPTCLNDIRADLSAYPVKSETISRVHWGFKREVDDIWPRVREDLRDRSVVWFGGHSLGGAMATIMASRCYHDTDLADPIEIYTYGSPRVGWSKYIDSLGSMKHYRWVNNNDIVACLPFWILGYRHHGCIQYIDSYGRYVQYFTSDELRDRWRGFVEGLKNGSIDFFSDHSIDRYIAAIESYRDRYK